MGRLVSVITLTYNHEPFIAQAIQSVLAQSYQDWEMIVLDDGSTDRTVELARSFADPRITVETQANAGLGNLARTYNTALRRAKGEVIGILEGDDYWPSDKLDVQVPDFDDPNVVLSSGLTDVVDNQGAHMAFTPHPLPGAEAQTNQPLGAATKEMLNPMRLTYTFPVATMLSRRTVDRIGGFQQPAYLPLVDYPTFLRLSLEGEFRFHENVVGYWRRHPSSTTLSNLPIIIEGAYRHAFEFIRDHRTSIPLTDADLDEVERQWDSFEVYRCALRGRLLAAEGRYGEAADAFKEGQRYRPGPKSRALLFTASAMSYLKLNPEPLFKAAGKGRLEDAVNLKSGDALVMPDDIHRTRARHSWRHA